MMKWSEYVNNLLREANAKIEDFENQRKTTGPEFPSPVRLQQRLLEITHERLQLQEDLKKLQDDYLLATQNLQSSTVLMKRMQLMPILRKSKG